MALCLKKKYLIGIVMAAFLTGGYSERAHSQEDIEEPVYEESQNFELDIEDSESFESELQETTDMPTQSEEFFEEEAATEQYVEENTPEDASESVAEEVSEQSEKIPQEYDPMLELYGNTDIFSYRERRGGWGAVVGLGISLYNPEDYQPDFAPTESYSTYYGAAETPMLELNISVKKNIAFFSLSADVGAGYFTNTNTDGGTLNLIPITFGGTLAIDGIFSEPYVAPYARGGGYLIYYRESQDNISVNGNTSVSPFYAVGLRFQLDWLDSDGDNSSFDEYGLHNTYLYVEGRQFFALNENEPDLSSPTSSPMHFNAGLNFEF